MQHQYTPSYEIDARIEPGNDRRIELSMQSNTRQAILILIAGLLQPRTVASNVPMGRKPARVIEPYMQPFPAAARHKGEQYDKNKGDTAEHRRRSIGGGRDDVKLNAINCHLMDCLLRFA